MIHPYIRSFKESSFLFVFAAIFLFFAPFSASPQPSSVKGFEFVGNLGNDEGRSPFKKPYAISIDLDRNVYVVDAGLLCVFKFSPVVSNDEKPTYWKGGKVDIHAKLKSPRGITVDSEFRKIFITDSDNHRVLRFSMDFVLERIWGELDPSTTPKAPTPGKFRNPEGCCIRSKEDFKDERIFVVDRNNNRIQEFTLNGVLAAAWSSNLNGPSGIAYSENTQRLYIANSEEHQVIIHGVNETGTENRAFGKKGTNDGEFLHPSAPTIDAAGNVWVADTLNNRIQVFDQDGNFLGKFGSSNELNGPRSVAVDNEEGYIFVADTDNGNVRVWRRR